MNEREDRVGSRLGSTAAWVLIQFGMLAMLPGACSPGITGSELSMVVLMTLGIGILLAAAFEPELRAKNRSTRWACLALFPVVGYLLLKLLPARKKDDPVSINKDGHP